ncbi:MAG TPA: PP2C family protein-serine/threonine phosphatase [Thermoanaerobaculia bacterium]|nr:PP2C family protein-serine/threonine phosphatase [Thermoanaerobaculia bacterium]
MRRSGNHPFWQQAQGFVREYTAGLSRRDFQRLFERDATEAYTVLTRDHDRSAEPRSGFRRLLFRARILFLGLSYKLSPARRLLFVLALMCFFLGVTGGPSVRQVRTDEGVSIRLETDFSRFWFACSTGALIYLLALELVDRIRVRDELEVARELQADLLPHHMPPVPGYAFAHSYRTANEVGGDYYDLTPLADGRVAAVVADASGHGMAAGLVMAIANATLKTALDLDPSPERVLALLNRTLCRTGTRRTFLSAFYAILTPETGQLEYVCAGHPFPLLRRADGSIEELGCGGLPLGIREPLQLTTRTATLEPGDLLLFYTDGLVEAIDPQAHDAFGFERLRAVLELNGGPPQLVHDSILGTFDGYVGPEPLRDDLTLLVIGRLPGPAAAPAETGTPDDFSALSTPSSSL